MSGKFVKFDSQSSHPSHSFLQIIINILLPLIFPLIALFTMAANGNDNTNNKNSANGNKDNTTNGEANSTSYISLFFLSYWIYAAS